MSKIYRNVIVPIPEDAHIDRKKGQVYFQGDYVYHPDKKYTTNTKRVIGRAISETEMYPNSYFRTNYPNIFNEHSADVRKTSPPAISIGLYSVVLAITDKIGLYEILIDSFGPEKANAIMDFAMYSIFYNSSVAKNFKVSMENHMAFSEKLNNDYWYSKLFVSISEFQVYNFKSAWVSKCIELDTQFIWHSIDGSNNDCDSVYNILSERGKSKSGTKGGIVGYTISVDANNGRPIYYNVYRGGQVDTKSFYEVILYTHSLGLTNSGVLLDRFYFTDKIISLVSSMGLKYVAMMKSNTLGYDIMVSKYGNIINNQVRYSLSKPGFYGITEKQQLFAKNPNLEGYVSLFYDSTNGTERVNYALWNIRSAVNDANNRYDNPEKDVIIKSSVQMNDNNELEGQIDFDEYFKMLDSDSFNDNSNNENNNSNNKPHIDKKYQKYVYLTNKDGQMSLILDADIIQDEIDSKGLSCIATSDDFGPNEADRLYDLRTISEITYDIIKNQLGFDVLGVHTTPGWEGKFCVGFISAIIRNEIQCACSECKIDTNKAIRELNLLQIKLSGEGNGKYVYYHSENSRQLKLLKKCGVNPEMLDLIAKDYNDRITNIMHSPIRKLPNSKQ